MCIKTRHEKEVGHNSGPIQKQNCYCESTKERIQLITTSKKNKTKMFIRKHIYIYIY